MAEAPWRDSPFGTTAELRPWFPNLQVEAPAKSRPCIRPEKHLGTRHRTCTIGLRDASRTAAQSKVRLAGVQVARNSVNRNLRCALTHGPQVTPLGTTIRGEAWGSKDRLNCMAGTRTGSSHSIPKPALPARSLSG